MQSRFKKILFLALFLSFFWGTWWGFYQDYQKRPDRNYKGEIQVLTDQTVFDDNFLKAFLEKEGYQLKVKTLNSPYVFIKELVSRKKYDIVIFNSYFSDSFYLSNFFSPFKKKEIPLFQNISIDFKALPFDLDQKYFIPWQWGVNGFIIDSSKKQDFTSLEQFYLDKNYVHQISFLLSPIEIFRWAIIFKPILKTWANTANDEELLKDLKSIKNYFPRFHNKSEISHQLNKVPVVQSSNGRAASLLQAQPQLQFVLPAEKAQLWITLIAITPQSHKNSSAAINALLKPEWSLASLKVSQEATTLTSLDLSPDLLNLQKSSALRKLKMSQFEIFSSHEAFEPTWTQALTNVFNEFQKLMKE